MTDKVDFEYLKYQKEFLETGGHINYTSFVNEVQFDDSYTDNIKSIVKRLFLNTSNFNTINLHSLMYEIKNADTSEEVKDMINSIYIANNVVTKNSDKHLSEHEVFISSFPPQVLNFFKALLENPEQMTQVDVIAILGIIWESRISIKLNEYIENLIDVSIMNTEADIKSIIDNESTYDESLFKEYIRGGRIR